MKRAIWMVAIGVVGSAALAAYAEEKEAGSAAGVGIQSYDVGDRINDADFVDVTAEIPELGGTVLEGKPEIKIRFDAAPDGITSHGVFEELGAARIRIVFPFNEHMQVIHGRLKITDSAGNVFRFGPGDSYFIAQGSTVIWEVLTPVFQKSFFDYTQPAN